MNTNRHGWVGRLAICWMLAAGEMTGDAKKVAAMTMAALNAVIGTEKVA